jgi:hypothetical protein
MDVVVTVPKEIWLDWIYEGDAAGEAPTGEEWGYYLYGAKPEISPGDRVYIVAHGRLRGYSPLTRIGESGNGYALCRQAGAVAVTIPEPIIGFRGWKYRWWEQSIEVPFPDWRTSGVVMRSRYDQEEIQRLAAQESRNT